MDIRETWAAERISRSLLARVIQHRLDIHRIVAEHHATAPRVFGSVARGQATTASDLDLLVDFSADASLLDHIGLQLDLIDLLGIKVDVVDSGSLRGKMRERIHTEAIAI